MKNLVLPKYGEPTRIKYYRQERWRSTAEVYGSRKWINRLTDETNKIINYNCNEHRRGASFHEKTSRKQSATRLRDSRVSCKWIYQLYPWGIRMPIKVVTLILIVWAIGNFSRGVGVNAQLALGNLTKIGIIPGKSYNLKITGITSHQYMVIKLLPNIENLTGCAVEALTNYKQMLTRILLPINNTLAKIKNAVTDKPFHPDKENPENFWGAVIGGIALGVATAAQITGSLALHNSLENAAAIRQMKEAIKATNEAVEELQTSTGQVLLAVSALQDQINTQFVPALSKIGCQVVSNSLGLRLNQYFSELSIVFGPNLRDPSSQTLSIQAISRAFNRDFDTLVKKLGYTSSDMLDLLESGGIRGRIIDVDMENYYIVLQIEYPSISSIPDAVVQFFNLITFNSYSEEWISIFPSQLLIRGNFISQIDVAGCVYTLNSILCSRDSTYPAGPTLLECARGDTSKCGRTRVVNTNSPRYALSHGVLFVNCMSVNCRCIQPEFSIVQDPSVTNTMIHADFCNEVMIGTIYVTVGPKSLPRAEYSEVFELGSEVNVDPIDVGNEIAAAQESLNKSKETLDKAKELLDKVDPKVINLGTFGSLIGVVVLISAWMVISLVWLCCLTKRVFFQSQDIERQRLIVTPPQTIGGFTTYGT
ncbi:fusion protein [memana virus]|uniref:Fusion glycoprotein F0 n=1 Tax=memana virus TaxID=2940997 RepID=A0AAE9HV37_9MONO|nr:fusion protein [memana virus]